MIYISKLDKYFNKGKSNEVHVIDNTNLEFDDVGLVCILGESGSGKTTLLNTVGGLDTFQSGNITIDGTTLNKYSSKEMETLRNSKFGYIFQDQYLLQDYTVEYNIRLALNMFEISQEDKEARIDYVLQAVDMKKFKKRLVSQLSGGQKQRIAIARALVKSPEIIFADEPTGNLDEANTIRIMSIIKKISKECLIVLVTHEKRIAELFADRIIYINDGKVVKDTRQEGKQTYQYSDDTNLYLKEFNKETYQNNNISINLFNSGEKGDIILNMVFKSGKLYIQTPSEADVVFLTSGDEMQMIDASRPEFDLHQVEDFDYALAPIKKRKKPKLSLQEIWKLANENVKMLGKKQLFMIVSLIITSILLVIAVADYMTTSAIDKKSIITEDSHYIEVSGRRNSSARNDQYYDSFNNNYDSFLKSKGAEDIYIDLNTSLSFTYDGFGQTKLISENFSDFSFVTLDHFQKKDLICGRMPENRNEIIVDKWLIDVFEASDSVLKTLMPNRNSFLNLQVNADITGQVLTIVGISNLDEPTVFIDKYEGISTATWTDKIASLQQLQKEYPNTFDNTQLALNEILVSETEFEIMKTNKTDVFVAKNGNEFKVAGTFPDKFGASFVIDDQYYKDILNLYICSSRNFLIYTDNKEDVLDYFTQNKGNFDTKFVQMIATDTYGKHMEKYLKERAITMNTRIIVTIAIFAISMMMLYYTMKSNVMKITQELTVYRLVGISKKSIMSAFILEVIIVTSYTVLPVVLFVSCIIKFISGTPSLQSNIVYPWFAVVVLLVFIYVVNTMVGIIPVYNIIKLPPAQIAEKE